MALSTCSSCGRPSAVVVVLEHQRKGERAPVEWVLGRCCFGTPATATLAQVKETSKTTKRT